MSRDWTPCEAVCADEEIYHMHKEYLHSHHFVMHNIKDDTEVKLYNDEARVDFPNLCYLLEGFETRKFETIKDDPIAYKVYQHFEAEVGKLADQIRKQVQEQTKIHIDDSQVDKTVSEWFLGRLDKGFYYNEYNNELFYEYINAQIRKERGAMVSDRFQLMERIDPDGYNGFGSGYICIMDDVTANLVHDDEGMLIVFEVEEGDYDAAYKEGEAYISEHYEEMVERMDKNEHDEDRGM